MRSFLKRGQSNAFLKFLVLRTSWPFIHYQSNHPIHLPRTATRSRVSTSCKHLGRINEFSKLYRFARKHPYDCSRFLLIPKDLIQVSLTYSSLIASPIHDWMLWMRSAEMLLQIRDPHGVRCRDDICIDHGACWGAGRRANRESVWPVKEPGSP